MPLFRCSQCGCVENTATSRYWVATGLDDEAPLCSECDPKIGEWHGKFDKTSADGKLLSSEGFLYSRREWDSNVPNHGDATLVEVVGESAGESTG